jgi:hypothetical protein
MFRYIAKWMNQKSKRLIIWNGGSIISYDTYVYVLSFEVNFFIYYCS